MSMTNSSYVRVQSRCIRGIASTDTMVPTIPWCNRLTRCSCKDCWRRLRHESTTRSLVMRSILISTLVLVTSLGCANTEVSTGEAELRSAIATFRTALNSGDSTSFFGLLAADLEVFAPGAHPIRGAEAHDS